MKSYPTWERAAADLGDKVIAGVSGAVASAKADLLTYRQTFPAWVLESTERGLAGWIHDRLWFYLISNLQDVPEVGVVDREPTRELGVGVQYVMRVKRHHEDGSVRTYPTQTALEFLIQPPQETLDGLEQWNLIAGYVWERETRSMGSAVISLRDGRRIIWEAHVDDGTVSEGGTSRPVKPYPTPPQIDPGRTDAERSGDGE